MRSIITSVSLAVLLFALGCNVLSPHRRDVPVGGSTDNATPKAENLIGYLNSNADKVGDAALKCTNLSIDCKANGQSVGLGGMMMCQTPRNFRLTGQVISQPAVDIGSNNDEFWYWISKNEPPYLFHCSYKDLERGVKVPFPFQPDMVVAALGIAKYDPNKTYEVNTPAKANYFELIESAVSPQGQPIKKVVVFSRTRAEVPSPQVIAYALKDAKGNFICTASIKSVQRNRETGAILPKLIVFNWPVQNIQMKMELNDIQVVKMNEESATRVFSRQNLSYQTFDLAKWTTDGPGLQRANATIPAPGR